MKKVTYLLLVMFATVLLTTSCEKDETVTPEIPIITLEEFAGYWSFVSCEYNGTIYYNCDDVENDPDVDLSMGTFVVDLDIELVPSNDIVDFNAYLDWINICADGTNYNKECTLNEKQNEFNSGGTSIFKILEYNKSTKTLKVKLIDPLDLDYVLGNAIYTWQK